MYFYKLTFELDFDNNSLQSIQTNCRLKLDKNYMKSCLLDCIVYFILRRYKFSTINHITIDSINDRCNITYEFYIKQPMPAPELRLNMIIAKTAELINSLYRNRNHPLRRKYSHTPFIK